MYDWPETDSTTEKLRIRKEQDVNCGTVAHINDKAGLHKVENASSSKAITLHCYMPPYDTCKIFPEGTAKALVCTSTFYSESGEKL